MVQIRASASAYVPAPPPPVYAILADYREGHPHILPERYFSDLVVEQGGVGAGTRIRFRMHVLGRARTMRAEVSEPEPGRILEEKDPDTGAVTTFTVEPATGGEGAMVTIETRWQGAGIRGLVERWTAPPLLRRIYAEQLQLLAERARQAGS